jgi:protein-S-isoprenylcysteine O-methyltransferase Ste14
MLTENLNKLAATSLGKLFLVSNFIALLSVAAVLIAIVIDFSEFGNKRQIKKEKKSIVATGTMLLFSFLFYILIISGTGKIAEIPVYFKIVLMIAGSVLLMIGAAVNILGRITLGKNWANQVTIYKDQDFISKGVFGIVRHPLYASLIWIFFGASLVYLNLLACFSNIIIFIPFMYYRAKQEEKFLGMEFKAYGDYKNKVGMFFPKFF